MITDRNERQQARPAALEQGLTVAYRRCDRAFDAIARENRVLFAIVIPIVGAVVPLASAESTTETLSGGS